MTKRTRAAKSVPGIPQSHDLSVAIEDPSTCDQHTFAFPPEYHLTVTTTRGVYIWDAHGVTEIFRSGSKGIVAAKRVASGSEMLAVADSQVVVLHEFHGNLQRSYRLKGSEGRVRLLKYDKESKSLFFTTNLQNAVQSYSLQQSKLLDPSHSHPSAPSVFAISCNSHFLISTSAAPPTIYLSDLSRQTPPVLVRPYCSSFSVVAAAFHPDREDFFLLAFADGTAAVFDALHFFRKHGKADRRKSNPESGSGGEIAFIRGLHATGTSGGPPTYEVDSFNGYDPGTGMVSVGDTLTGITAVAFVPGRSATAVTAGADGKCCVVDFTQLTKDKAVLLKSWHIRRPATSLSIICSSQRRTLHHMDGVNDSVLPKSREEPGGGYYIAIGRQDGRVLVFNLDGKPVGNQVVDADGSRIIDVEWTPIDQNSSLKAKVAVPGLRVAADKDQNGQDNSPGRSTNVQILQKHRLEREPSDRPQVTTVDPVSDPSTLRKLQGLGKQPTEQAGEYDPISSSATTSDPVTLGTETPPISIHVSPADFHTPTQKRRISELSAYVAGTKPHAVVVDEGTPPPVPPRPSPKPGGRLQKRRSQMAYQTPTYLGVVSEARRMSSNPRVTGVLFGPRKPPATKPQAARIPATVPNLPDAGKEPEDDEIDAQVSPYRTGLKPPQRRTPDPPAHKTKTSTPSSGSVRSYKTASSQFPSDGSDDTVIDWSVGLAPQPVPSLKPSPPKTKGLLPKAAKKKGHLSLSVSSASRDDPSTPGSYTSDGNTSPDAPPHTTLPKQPLPTLQLTHPSADRTSKSAPKQKGHISIPPSPTTTTTSASTSSNAPSTQNPPLRKSPRIPQLSSGLPTHSPQSSPDTVKHSVTGLVLKAYTTTTTPSPSKPSRLRPGYTSLPPRSATSIEQELRHCDCADAVEARMQVSFAGLRDEVVKGFEAQRTWFEGVVGRWEEEREERRGLVSENRWLRGELERRGRS